MHYKHHTEEYSSHIRPQTCYAYQPEQSSQQSISHGKPRSAAAARSIPASYKNLFEQILLKSQSASPSDRQPLLPDFTKKQTRKTSVSDTRLSKKETPETTTVRSSVSDQQLAASTKLPDVSSRLPNSKPTDHQRVPSHTNRTLRYMVHHFPQVPSRGSSAMVYI